MKAVHGSLVFLLALAGCARGPAARYAVSLSRGQPGHLDVVLELRRVPRGTLTLKAYAPAEVVRITGVQASGPGREPLAVRADYDTITVDGRTVGVPRFILEAPVPSEVVVRYTVWPGNREGDEHLGYSGRAHGHVGDRFALLGGRNVFILPQPAEDLRDIEVGFGLPASWTAIATWPATPAGQAPPADTRRPENAAPRFRPGVGGRHAADHLVAGAIGLGRFRERSFRAGGTVFRLAFEAGIPDEDATLATSRLEKAAAYLRSIFGRDLGPEYLTILAPATPDGDEVTGEAWATGQGGTLAPLTTPRLRLFSERLIDAHVRDAPYRTEIRAADEFWIVDAIRHWYSWRAVAAAGLVTEEEVARSLAADYLTAFRDPGPGRDLERLYRGPVARRSVRQVLAPMVLAHLEREVRDVSGGRLDLDAVLGRLLRDRAAPSLWSLLAAAPETGAADWNRFRDRFVRGAELLPVESWSDLDATRRSPDPPAGPVTRSLTLAYTGGTEGYLENCGCNVNQAGGVARRATVLERLRRRDPGTLVLDAGDVFHRPKGTPIDFLSREELGLYLRALDQMGYRTVAVGTNELAFGPDAFRDRTRGLPTPWVAAGIRAAAAPIAPPSRIVPAGALKVGVIGVFEPPRGREAVSLFEERTSGVRFDEPVEVLRREAPRLAGTADLVVAIGRLTPATILRVADSCPELDVIVSTDDRAPRRAAHATADWHLADEDGFLGRTLVLYARMTSYGLGVARLGIDRDGRIAAAAIEDILLDGSIPDHPDVRALLDHFYDRVGRTAAAQESVAPLFAWDPARLRGHYVGAEACAGCHEAEYRQWAATPHADAYKTLLDRHRHFQPRCVSCHVVGYGADHGYRLGAPERGLANVQCEACHGPGGDHASAPGDGAIERRVPARVCLECHDEEHSDRFVYEERLPKVVHGRAGHDPGPPGR